MKRILITGASGFVGKNLVRYLTHNSDARIETISLKSGMPDKIDDSFYAVIHLAGKAHDLKKTANQKEYFEINTELTKSLFQRFLVSKASVFIFVSSVKAVADKVENILTEETIPNPLTAYGKSKLEAEKYLLGNELPDGKKIFILRPCMIHGPGNKGNLNLLYKIVAKGLPWPLGAFENKRSFCTVENLCFVIHELVSRNDIDSGVYQISDNEPISTNELISLISLGLAKKGKIWKIPKSVITGIAWVGDKTGFPLNTERLQKLTESYMVSNQKIRKAIGIEFPQTTIEGLKNTIRSFKDQ